MPMYIYKAKDRKGTYVKGLVDAPNTQQAARLIREKQLYIVHLAEQRRQLSLDLIIHPSRRMSFNHIVAFTRQLATLVTSGLSLTAALTILRTQSTSPALTDVILDIERHITGGGTLASALSRHKQYFSPVYIGLIKAGEASGHLDLVLTRLAQNVENERDFRAKVKNAMIYPVIIVIGMICVIFVMMTVVVPKLTELYSDFDVELPWSTRLLVAMSGFMVRSWWMILLLLVVGGYFFHKWNKTEAGKYVIHSAMLKIPIIGDLQTKVLLAEFARTLSMLTSAGIHILDGLAFLHDSIDNRVFKQALSHVSVNIEKGFSLGDTFAQYPEFPVIVPQMMRVGEETGKLDESMEKLATYFEKEAEYIVKNLTTIIEPVILVLLGLGVGFIVYSVITPIYSLTTQIN